MGQAEVEVAGESLGGVTVEVDGESGGLGLEVGPEAIAEGLDALVFGFLEL